MKLKYIKSRLKAALGVLTTKHGYITVCITKKNYGISYDIRVQGEEEFTFKAMDLLHERMRMCGWEQMPMDISDWKIEDALS